MKSYKKKQGSSLYRDVALMWKIIYVLDLQMIHKLSKKV